MNVAVNTRLLVKDQLDGIGVFASEILRRMVEQHPEHTFTFIFERPYSSEFIFAENVRAVVVPPQNRHALLWWYWFQRAIPKALRSINADLFLSPDGFIPLNSPIPTVAVIHDLNFEHYPEHHPFFFRWYYRHFFPRFAKAATGLATVSNCSRKDIVTLYGVAPEKIDVVYNSAGVGFRPLIALEQKAVKEQYTGGADYFYFVGTFHYRKNIATVLKAFDLYKQKTGTTTKLVLVGGAKWGAGEIRRVYEKMEYRGDVIIPGRLPDKELHRIAGGAIALVFVPYFEGFGIPVLEAMHADTPVITSNCSSLPEIAGNAALLVDPFSVQAIAEAMDALQSNTQLRELLIARGRVRRDNFSWEDSARKLWETIERAIETAGTGK